MLLRLRASNTLGGSCTSHVSVAHSVHPVEMDALVRAVPTGDVAKVASDAQRLIDVRHDLVVQIQVLPVRHLLQAETAKSSMVAKPFSSIQWLSPSIMSSTMR